MIAKIMIYLRKKSFWNNYSILFIIIKHLTPIDNSIDFMLRFLPPPWSKTVSQT